MRNENGKRRTLALVCSLGGHLEQMRRIERVYGCYDWFIIVPRESSNTFASGPEERVYTVDDVNEGRGIRNPLLLLAALWQTFIIFLREHPKAVISTGAGIAVPAFIVARIFGSKTVFIESFARIRRPSISAKVCYRLSDLFLVQHEELLKFFPKAEYYGSLYEYL